MNSKMVILLGLLASLLLIFLCVFFNSERYYKELGLGQKETNKVLASKSELLEEDSDNAIIKTGDNDKVESITVENKDETSSFSYYVEDNKTHFLGTLPLLDNGDEFKTLIAECSKSKSCENNVTFLDNGETLSWKAFTTSVLVLFDKEEIVSPKLSIDKKDIKLEGEFANKRGKEQLLALVEENKKTYNISDLTTLKKEKKIDIPKTKNVSKEASSKEKEEVSPKDNLPATAIATTTKKETSDKTLANEQKKITALLKSSKITFKRNSGKLKNDGKKVLDKIAKLLLKEKNILINVEGYTDAGGKEKINLWISQVRADGVKKYLVKKGIKASSITAKGFGEKKLLLPKAPYDPSNRRVEIHLKRK